MGTWGFQSKWRFKETPVNPEGTAADATDARNAWLLSNPRACSFCVSVGGNQICSRQLKFMTSSRSANMIVKRFRASLHSGIGSVHFFEASWITR